MCPLRIILIFLSATLAGFFVLRSFKSPSPFEDDAVSEKVDDAANAAPLSTKVSAALGKGFWTFVDMASGKYLWKNLVAAQPKARVA